jgi:hypothetical protein
MDVMQGGRVADLYEVANRLHAWRVRIPAKLNSHSGQREHPDP